MGRSQQRCRHLPTEPVDQVMIFFCYRMKRLMQISSYCAKDWKGSLASGIEKGG